MSKNITARLSAAIGTVVNMPEMRDAITRQGREPETNTPEEFGKFIAGQLANNIKLAKIIGLKVD